MPNERRPVMPNFRRSLIAKIFLVSFLSVHVPLIALIVFLLFGFDTGPVPVFTLILVATLLGTAACLYAIWHFIRPLHHLAGALQRYPRDKSVLKLQSTGNDEIAIVTDATKSMLSQVEELAKQLKHQATTDFLTGLANRRRLSEQVPAMQSQAERAGEPISIVLFDLDNFKLINDDYGHDVGDNVLMIVGEIVKDSLRPYDLAARIGGEEFCIVLPRTSGEDALTIAERLRAAFEASYLDPLPKGRITCSFGVVQAGPGERLQQLLRRADTALYRAKDAGRNRVIGSFLGSNG
jgi:diguanylate cyclase (GGDEF)-like protein